MKTVQMFESEDGRRFKTEAECQRYEELLPEVMKCNGILRTAIDDECKFANGYGYVQQDASRIARFDARVAELIEEFLSKEYAESYRACPTGIVGRFLSDGGGPVNDALYKLWCRRQCIDKNLREWGQPFYAGAGGPDVWKNLEMPGEWPVIQEPTS